MEMKEGTRVKLGDTENCIYGGPLFETNGIGTVVPKQEASEFLQATHNLGDVYVVFDDQPIWRRGLPLCFDEEELEVIEE